VTPASSAPVTGGKIDEAQPQKKRGFWGRLFGRDGKSDEDKKDEEKKRAEEKKKADEKKRADDKKKKPGGG
jgi:hypothetical protein